MADYQSSPLPQALVVIPSLNESLGGEDLHGPITGKFGTNYYLDRSRCRLIRVHSNEEAVTLISPCSDDCYSDIVAKIKNSFSEKIETREEFDSRPKIDAKMTTIETQKDIIRITHQKWPADSRPLVNQYELVGISSSDLEVFHSGYFLTVTMTNPESIPESTLEVLGLKPFRRQNEQQTQ